MLTILASVVWKLELKFVELLNCFMPLLTC